MAQTLTTDDERAEAIERDRRNRERQLLLLLLLLMDESRRHALSAVRLGHDPLNAVVRVVIGDSRIEQPGTAPVLDAAMRESYAAGARRAFRIAGETPPTVDDALERAGARYERYSNDAASLLGYAVGKKLTDATRETTGIRQRLDAIKEVFADGFSRANSSALDLAPEQATLRAYNDGLHDGYNDPVVSPNVAALRHVSIIDEGTTVICRERHGLTLPPDDPYWRTNWAPLHWRCRSVIVPVLKSEWNGEYSSGRPATPPMASFGAAPSAAFRFRQAALERVT